ncbi:MAG: DUF2939 domain-containing protein [Hyphomicrobiaceae bacterium]
MRKLLLGAGLVIVLFYLAWPTYSAHQIFGALQRSDARLLARKVDFPAVRTALRPFATREVDKALGQIEVPGGREIVDSLRRELAPGLVDSTLDTIVTPDGISRLYTEGPELSRAFAEIVAQNSGLLDALRKLVGGDDSGRGGLRLPGGIVIPGMGGFGLEKLMPEIFKTEPEAAKQTPPAQPGAKPVLRERAAKPEFGFGNVQDFYFTGPVSFVVAVSVDPKATRADLIAEMAFRDFDWKLVRLVPAR